MKKEGTVKRVDDVYRVIEVDDKKIKISSIVSVKVNI